MLIPEAAAANAYWGAWAGLPIQWARRDHERVPRHWRVFGTRASPLTSNPRLAADPGNAILNYLYGVLEAETRIACLQTGLDPGLGVLHSDQRNRDSLALDLMEAARPDVDSVVLDVLAARAFRAGGFAETRQGQCRVLPPLSHELARTVTIWSQKLAPIVEEVAGLLAMAPASRVNRLPTPLTQSNRSSGRHEVRRRRQPTRPIATSMGRTTCVVCGSEVKPGRRYCLDCRPDVEVFRASGAEALAEARRDGRDPAHGGDVARIRGEKWRERRRLERDWENTHGTADPDLFRNVILPSLAVLPTRQLVAATGLTRAYCARIKRGELVPHARHWGALGSLARDRERHP
jgi:hypothetical protein